MTLDDVSFTTKFAIHSGGDLIRAGGLNVPASPISGVVLRGLVPRIERASWVGSLSRPPIVAIFARTGHVWGFMSFLLPPGDSSLVFLLPSPPSNAVPSGGGLRLQPTTISLRSSPYPPRSARAPQKPLLPRRPSPSRLLRGVLLRGVIRLSPRANPRPPLPRLALRCPDGEAVLGPHLDPDTPAYSNSS